MTKIYSPYLFGFLLMLFVTHLKTLPKCVHCQQLPTCLRTTRPPMLLQISADASDDIYSNTPAIDGGGTDGQIFYGTSSHLTDVYTCFQPGISAHLPRPCYYHGVPSPILVDHASNEGSKLVLTTSAILSLVSGSQNHYSSSIRSPVKGVVRLWSE